MIGIKVQFKILDERLGTLCPLPDYQTWGSSGMDLPAMPASRVAVPGRGRLFVPCGFAIALPWGYEAQIRPRSGLAFKHGITVLNSPGTIDCDYRGPIGVVLYNTTDEPFWIEPGDRIAQMVIAPVTQAIISVVQVLDETERGAGGFGSTGVAA